MEAMLRSRVVAITGGARGIGLATARELCALGATVVLGDLDADLAAAEGERIGGLGLPLDVTDEASFAGFVARVEEQAGRIDVLVNNAGIMPTGPFLAQPHELLEQLYAINVLGVARGVRLVLPGMLARGSGQIVNVASVAGRSVAAGMANYCGTKHAVVGMTRALRREHHGRGVRFTLVMPSFTNTRLTSGASAGRVPVAEPLQVARGIAGTVVGRRDDVIVPRSAAVLTQAFERLLPRRAADAIARALGADLMFLDELGHAREMGQTTAREVVRS